MFNLLKILIPKMSRHQMTQIKYTNKIKRAKLNFNIIVQNKKKLNIYIGFVKFMGAQDDVALETRVD